MTTTLKPMDVVILGLGLAGGVAALPLTRAGLNVVGLAAGPRITSRDLSVDEFSLMHVKRIKSPAELPTWRPDDDAPVRRLAVSTRRGPMMLNAVGGTSIIYGSRSYRMTPWEMEPRSRTVARYGASAIPEGCTVADWPLSYDELEPYYEKAEYEIGVSGKAGNLNGEIIEGGNVFEGPRRRPFPMPPVRASGYNDLTMSAARRLGWHPYIVPVAVNSEPYDGRAACTYCGFCTNNGCYVDAKGSTNVTVIPKAEATGNLQILTHARATRIEVDGQDRATGVMFVKGGEEFFQPASVVLLSAYTYENVRLLLNSTSSGFPNGLANRRSQVGKHYTAHLGGTTYAIFAGKRLNRWGGPGAGAAVDDWTGDNFDHTGMGFFGGGILTDGSGSAQTLMSIVSTAPPGVPLWGSAWKAWMHENANSIGMISQSTEAFTYDANYLDLDPVVKDPYGMPVIRITFNWQRNEDLSAEHGFKKSEQWLREAGATQTWNVPSPAEQLSLHAYGGTRMGDDPETSVVDRWCFSHDVPNLGILGASCMPTSGSHNPALTVQALAWRTAEHLLESWRTIAG